MSTPAATPKGSTDRHAALLVFVLFLAVILVINFSSSPFLSPYDPYYHVKHAQTYWSGEEINLPVFSSINSPGADLYIGYHLLLAPFTATFSGHNYSVLLAGSKIFHAVIGALAILTFFYILRYLLRHQTQKEISVKAATYIALAASLMVFVISPTFTDRLLLQRPHLISIIIVLLAFFFIVRKKYLSLFIASALFPLLYSTSFFIIIPALIYTLCYVLYYHPPRLGQEALKPTLIVLLGLGTGILLHPQSAHYLYNAYYLHILAVINVYRGHIEGKELSPPDLFSRELVWLVPFTALVIHYGYRMVNATTKKIALQAIAFTKFYLLALTATFFLMSLFVERAIEYLIPYVVILVVWTSVDDLPPVLALRRRNKDTATRTERRTAAFWRLLCAALVIYFLFTIFLLTSRARELPPVDRYQEATQFIKNNSSPGDIVFHQAFSNYPQLVFFNNHNRYTMGMGSIFTYEKYPEQYWLWHHITTEGNACREKVCGQDTIENPHKIISRDFNAKFVFYDAAIATEGHKKFKETIEQDPGFEKVFVDERYPEVSVYRVQ